MTSAARQTGGSRAGLGGGSRWRAALVFAGLGLALAAPAGAQSEPAASRLDEVRERFEQGLFEEALEQLEGVAVPEDRDGLIEYLTLRGMIAYGVSDSSPEAEDVAREAFRELLSIDPHARLPAGHSPRFTAFLELVRAERERAAVVDLSLLPSPARDRLRLGLAGEVELVADVLVWLEEEPGRFVRRAARCDGDECELTLSTQLAARPAVRGYAVATASSADRHRWLGGVGAPQTPFTYVLAAPGAVSGASEPGPHESPWLWIGVTGAVVAGIVIAVLVATLDATYQCPSDGRPCFDLP